MILIRNHLTAIIFGNYDSIWLALCVRNNAGNTISNNAITETKNLHDKLLNFEKLMDD